MGERVVLREVIYQIITVHQRSKSSNGLFSLIHDTQKDKWAVLWSHAEDDGMRVLADEEPTPQEALEAARAQLRDYARGLAHVAETWGTVEGPHPLTPAKMRKLP